MGWLENQAHKQLRTKRRYLFCQISDINTCLAREPALLMITDFAATGTWVFLQLPQLLE